MNVSNVTIMDIEASLEASAYPMKVELDKKYNIVTACKLGSSEKGEGHDQFLTGIRVAFDLTCSNKMWIELERYRFIEFVSSQSTMHRIAKMDINKCCNKYVDSNIKAALDRLIMVYAQDKSPENYLKVLYNVPSGLEITARLTTNYRALKTVYAQRKNHRLPEWREFCKWVEGLPMFEQLCLGGSLDE